VECVSFEPGAAPADSDWLSEVYAAISGDDWRRYGSRSPRRIRNRSLPDLVAHRCPGGQRWAGIRCVAF